MIEEISSMAAILSLTDGPFSNLTIATIIAANK